MKNGFFCLAVTAVFGLMAGSASALESQDGPVLPVARPLSEPVSGPACDLYPLSLSVTCGTPGEGVSMGYVSLVGSAGEALSAPLERGFPQHRRLYRFSGTLTTQSPGSAVSQTSEVEGSYSEQDSMGNGWFFAAAGLTLNGKSYTISGGEFEGARIASDGQQWSEPCKVTYL